MLETRDAAIGILIPFLGTALGACFVFFLRGEVRPWVQKLLLGFASGVMIAASVWSLIIPAIESAHAIAYARELAPTMSKDDIIVVNLSGRGDKDVAAIARYRGRDIHD